MKQLLTILLLTISVAGFAQGKKEAEIKIITSANCDRCKAIIERDMIFEKGVKKSDLEVETKTLTVVYKTKKTDPDRIRKRISISGYDADSLKADPVAQKKLPTCCQPGGHVHGSDCDH